jgi:type I restriction enzyme S subunit
MSERILTNLGDVITFERGLTYSKADEVPESATGVLRSNNVDLYNHSLNLDEIKFLNPSFVVPANKKVRKDSILMCMSNGSKEHLGKVAIIDKDLDYAFGGFMGLLTPNKAKVYPKYLYYTLISPDFKKHIRGLSDGANINNLKYADLSSFSFALFPIQEQQRIVGILDAEFEKIDALKVNAEKNLRNAKDLFQAALRKEINSDITQPLIVLCESIIDCPHSTPIKSSTKTDYPCIRTSELGMGNIIWSSMQYVSKDEYQKRIGRLTPRYEDIVYGREGTIGNAIMIPKEYHFCLGQRTTLFRPNKSIVNPQYLLYCVLSPFVYKQAMEKNAGCGVAHVNVADIKQFKIPMGRTIIEQQSIVSKLDEISNNCNTLQDNYTQTIALCDDLKQALLRKAFSGEL